MVDLGGVLGGLGEDFIAFWDMGGLAKTCGFPLFFNDFGVF